MPDMHSVDDTSVLTAINPTMDSNVYQHDDGQNQKHATEPSETTSKSINSTPDAKPSIADGWRSSAVMKTESAAEQLESSRSEADSSCTVKMESDASFVHSDASPTYDRSYSFGASLEGSSYLQPLPSLASLALSPASSFHNRLISATASSDANTTTPSGGFPMTPPCRSPSERSFGLHDVYYCHLCTFVGSHKSEFDEHMATHFEHQCPNCDYTSRTEGRLRRHIKDFHSNPDETMTRREQSKPKTMRCRQCNYSTQDKYEFWNHQRNHIKDEKMLQCPKCPFVTEYKHHLEYHLRNHFGSKPYKCDRCNYSCVNKSMLNSHMKSHTNVYQYRCADCTYATKYCHSLKLHLKKYSHKPATVLNPDGSLPTDGSGDFELVSKRGPPRGPRGPRKDRSPPPGFTPSLGPTSCQMPLPGLLPGMPNGMWPMMTPRSLFSAGFPNPPPLIPFPGMSPLCLQMPSPMMPGMESLHQLDRGVEDGPSLYRRYQDFLYAASQQDDHYKKINAEMSRRMISTAQTMASSPALEPLKSSPSVSPQVAAPDDSHKKALVADLAACIEAEARECGECPLDLTKPCQRDNQHADDVQQYKRKTGEDGAWSSDCEQIEQQSRDGASPRKRSRKGKAYKLDTLCLKLQEKCTSSPPEGYESDEYGSDFEDSSPSDQQQVCTPAKSRDPEDHPEDALEKLEQKLTTLSDKVQIRTLNGHGGKRDKEEEKDSGNEDHNSTDNSEHVKEPLDEQKLSPDNPDHQRQDVLDPNKLIQATCRLEPHFAKTLTNICEDNLKPSKFECCHCGIMFQDFIMYTVHMSYHGYDDPFKCNMCGHEAENRFQFFLHIARAAHN